MPHLVFDKEPYEQYRQQNAHQWIGKVKQVKAFDVQLGSDKKMGIVNGILKDYGSQTADNTDEKAQYIQKLPVTDIVDLPSDDLVKQMVFVPFHPKKGSKKTPNQKKMEYKTHSDKLLQKSGHFKTSPGRCLEQKG
jgi:hypothetical protein